MSAARRPRRPLAWIAGPLVIGGVALLTLGGAGAAGTAGSQGIDTSLAATPSQVTVNGRGAFADLAITVNQTKQLTNQTVSITWTGGVPTQTGPGRFGQHYLQIMQCWGDDDGTVAGNPGPPPEQCVQGAVAGNYGGLPVGLYPSGFALSRVVSRPDWPNFDANVGFNDGGNVWLPFRAVDGKEVKAQTDPNFNPSVQGGSFWLNPYFNQITTNEIAGAITGEDGRGAELFQVNTGVESSGLGCGQKKQPVAGGATKVPTCWIVVVPRGSATDEDVGTPYASTPDQYGVATSPVSPTAWKNRIAIPLEFNPVDSPCRLGADEARISGSEMALPAVASWQPSLCGTGKLPPFAFAPVSDAAARQQIASGVEGGPGMAVSSQPLDAASNTPESPVVYAPLTISGVTIGFNIERNPRPDAPADAQRLSGVRVANISLTPRLVAKLLTQSYKGAVSIQVAPPYAWMSANPAHLGRDPDFQRFNTEFELLDIADTRTFSSIQIPAGNTDAAAQVWEWILADPEAKAWLDGAPDEWGMKVNPVYATKQSANSTGIAFGSPLPTSFPKADPFCYQAPARGPGNSIVPPVLCGTDWVPYTRGWSDSARIGRFAADGARITENTFAQSASEVWTRELPQFLGRRGMLVLTDTPSAAQYGLQTASLSRSGDNGDTRTFIAPDTAGLMKGAASMKARTEPTVLEPTPAAPAPGAYPLTNITYGAVKPLNLTAAERTNFAAFVDYAVGAGQVSGLSLGQLPRGYAPLSDAMKRQGVAAAKQIRTLQAPPAPAPTTVPTSTTAFVDSGGGGFGGGGGGGGGFTGGGDTGGGDFVPPVDTTPVTETTAAPLVDTTAVPPETTVAAVTTTTIATTPATDVGGTRYTLPGLGMVALGSALGALEITKRPRRATSVEQAALSGDRGSLS